MNRDKLLQLWDRVEDLLWNQGIRFDTLDPNVEGIAVPGNRADVITHIIISRIVNAMAWKARDTEGNILSYLELHERAAYIVPEAVRLAKLLKRSD